MQALSYSYEIDGAILAIEDLRGGKSVFMGIDEVLAQIRAEVGSCLIDYILWRGEDEVWDLLLPKAIRGEFGMAIYPLGAPTLSEAKAKLWTHIAKGLLPNLHQSEGR